MATIDINIDSQVGVTITNAALVALMAANNVSSKKIYRVTDGGAANQPIDIFGLSVSTVSAVAFNHGTGRFGYYTPGTDSFVPIQELRFVDVTGTEDALVATFNPPFIGLTDGTVIAIRAKLANLTTTPTINVDTIGAKEIVRNFNLPLFASDIVLDGCYFLVYDITIDKWVLTNPSINYGVFEKNTGLGGVTVGASVTTYCHAFGSTITFSTTENSRQNIIQRPCIITSAKLITRTIQSALAGLRYTLRKNGVDTGMTIDIPLSGGIGIYNSAGGPISFAANDLIGWKAVNTAAATSASVVDIALTGIYTS